MTPIRDRYSWFGICVELIVNEKWSSKPVLIRNLYNLSANPGELIGRTKELIGTNTTPTLALHPLGASAAQPTPPSFAQQVRTLSADKLTELYPEVPRETLAQLKKDMASGVVESPEMRLVDKLEDDNGNKILGEKTNEKQEKQNEKQKTVIP